jgi:quercetin dioxygenase-like cupin family protein
MTPGIDKRIEGRRESCGDQTRGDDCLKRFRIEEYLQVENPVPGNPYRPEILTHEHKAKELGGMFGLLSPGNRVPYHYHKNRESLILVIAGEAIEVIEGKEIPIQEGDVIFILAGEKHMTVNRSTKDFRYLEFFTRPPLAADFVEAT